MDTTRILATAAHVNRARSVANGWFPDGVLRAQDCQSQATEGENMTYLTLSVPVVGIISIIGLCVYGAWASRD